MEKLSKEVILDQIFMEEFPEDALILLDKISCCIKADKVDLELFTEYDMCSVEGETIKSLKTFTEILKKEILERLNCWHQEYFKYFEIARMIYALMIMFGLHETEKMVHIDRKKNNFCLYYVSDFWYQIEYVDYAYDFEKMHFEKLKLLDD